jgi:adenylosuccinate lyase
MGVGLAQSLISYDACLKGIGKLELNADRLLPIWMLAQEVLAEPIQTVMRRYNIEQPYEKLKKLTRGQAMTRQMMVDFVNSDELAAVPEVGSPSAGAAHSCHLHRQRRSASPRLA